MRQDLNQRETEKLEDFFSSLNGAQAPLLLLDYDGTLADFRINRFDARPWAGVRELLSDHSEGQSHAADASLQAGLRAKSTPCCNCRSRWKCGDCTARSGCLRMAGGRCRKLRRKHAQSWMNCESNCAAMRLVGLFEDKPNAVVMHWRGHSSRQAKHIEQKTRALFEPAAQMSGLSLLEFEAGVELRVGTR